MCAQETEKASDIGIVAADDNSCDCASALVSGTQKPSQEAAKLLHATGGLYFSPAEFCCKYNFHIGLKGKAKFPSSCLNDIQVGTY